MANLSTIIPTSEEADRQSSCIATSTTTREVETGIRHWFISRMSLRDNKQFDELKILIVIGRSSAEIMRLPI